MSKIKEIFKWIWSKIEFIVVMIIVFLVSLIPASIIIIILKIISVKDRASFDFNFIDEINVFLITVGLALFVLEIISYFKVKKIEKRRGKENKKNGSRQGLKTNLTSKLLQEPEKFWEIIKDTNEYVKSAHSWTLRNALLLFMVVFASLILFSNTEKLNEIIMQKGMEPQLNYIGFLIGIFCIITFTLIHVKTAQNFIEKIKRIRESEIKEIRAVLDQEVSSVGEKIQNRNYHIEKNKALLIEKEEELKKDRQKTIWSILMAWAIIITFLIGGVKFFPVLFNEFANFGFVEIGFAVLLLCGSIWIYSLAVVSTFDLLAIEDDSVVWFLRQHIAVCEESKRKLQENLQQQEEKKRQEMLRKRADELAAEDRRRKSGLL